MRRTITTAALTALVAIPLIAGPTAASASCRGRANTGTVIGGVGGALVGNSISRGGGGAIIGGLAGGVLGHQIAKSGCVTHYSRHASYRRRHRHSSHYAANQGYYRPGSYSEPAYAAPAYSGQAYYDQNGNLIRR